MCCQEKGPAVFETIGPGLCAQEKFFTPEIPSGRATQGARVGLVAKMSLRERITTDMKTAMKAKDKAALEALRAVKSALLLAATEKGAGESSEEAEMKLLQKLVKQRKDAAGIYHEQGRADLAEVEEQQIGIIEKYLPLGEIDTS